MAEEIKTELVTGHVASQHGSKGHEQNGIESLLWPTISFSIYFAVMVGLYLKKGKPALKARKATYLQKAEEGNRLLEAARRRLELANVKKSNLELELLNLKKYSKDESEIIVSTLLSDANNRADYLVEDAKTRIIQEEKQAEEELKKEIASKAVLLAKAKFKQGWNNNADRSFIASNLNNLNPHNLKH